MDAKRVKGGRAQKNMTYVPRTKLGRRLLAIRQKIVASGQPLLDWAGVEAEVRIRRGESAEDHQK
jgi:hypothetical protein